MKPASKNILFGLLFIISISTLLPILGLTHFHTKGEPRETIVAVSMLEDGNWILPRNNGGDIAYKPPMYHWLTALGSMIFNRGDVNEYTSRLPSALAAIIIASTMFLFYSRRSGNYNTAFLSAILFLSAFEVHRSATAARVDMVLTVFIVLALFQLYRWYEKGLKGIPAWAILFMSAATLTKGPVGIVLPCLVSGVFLLLRKERFFKICYKLFGIAIASCILPALWYYIAYLQAGREFLDLIIEENFDRFTGNMSYSSHNAPPFYYLYITLTGFLPWTLLVVISLFALTYKGIKRPVDGWWKELCNRISAMAPARLFSLTAILVILFFYLIPDSKRSVYLLPIYPFLSYFLAEYMRYLVQEHRKAWRVFGILLSTISGIFFLLFIGLKAGWFERWISAESLYYLESFKDWNFWDIVCLIVLILLIHDVYKSRDIQSISNRYSYSVITLFFWVQFTLDTAVLPNILNRKSDYSLAQQVENVVPDGPVYSYIGAPMMRFFVINFYTHNRVVNFEDSMPEDGYLLVGEREYAAFVSRHTDYNFEEIWKSERRGNDIRDIVCMYRFNRKNGIE